MLRIFSGCWKGVRILTLTLVLFMFFSGCEVSFSPTDLSALSLSKTLVSMLEGENVTITVDAIDSEGYSDSFTASSSNESVVSVSTSGSVVTIFAVAAGAATVAVTSGSGITKSVGVTVSTVSSGSGESGTFRVDLKASYFSSLGTTSLDVYIDDEKVGSIQSSEVSSDFTSFSFDYSGTLSSITIESGGYRDIFDDVSDFATPLPDDFASLDQLGGVTLYPYYSLWSEAYTGTGAYANPSAPSFSISSSETTSDSITLGFSSFSQNPSGITYDVYVSTQSSEIDGWTVITRDASTKVTSVPIDPAAQSSFTVNGLDPETTYYIMVTASDGYLITPCRYARSETTEVGTQAGFATALESSGFTWITGGDAQWEIVGDMTHDGVDAAKAGAISHGQNSWLETEVTVPAGETRVLSFWWKVSSEDGFDPFIFSVDGIEQTNISGIQDWIEYSGTLAAGIHTLRWSYEKDGSLSGGDDTAWLDQISFTP